MDWLDSLVILICFWLSQGFAEARGIFGSRAQAVPLRLHMLQSTRPQTLQLTGSAALWHVGS